MKPSSTTKAPGRHPHFQDYSQEVKLVSSKGARVILVSLSFVFLTLGVIGVFLPILPTTPFILLSAYLYGRSSSRFYNWLMNHRILGPPLRNWKENGRIPFKSKVFAVIMIIGTIGFSVIYVVPILAVKILLSIVGCLVSIYIISRPS